MEKMTILHRIAWKEAAWVFIVSRLSIIGISILGTTFLSPEGLTRTPLCTATLQDCLSSWFRWDAMVYVEIARHGYTIARNTVFFPLWPLLMHSIAFVFGDSIDVYYIVGLVLANLFFYLALVVFYSLLSVDYDGTTARNALFYLAFSPYALFFFAGYAEALFLLLSLIVFLCLQREKWWLAGIAGFCVTLTRSPGIVLIIPFIVIFLQRFWRSHQAMAGWREKIRALLAPDTLAQLLLVLLIPLGIVVFMLYLGLQHYHPLAFSEQEALYWKRPLNFPLNGIIFTLYHIFIQPQLVPLNVCNLLFTIIPLSILILGWKHLPLHYSLFALTMAILALSYSPVSTGEPLSAAPRYMQVIFPIIVICAQWAKNPRFDRAFLALSLPTFAFNIVLFVNHHWVA
jgi:Gpi18-like mannosyltransferase